MPFWASSRNPKSSPGIPSRHCGAVTVQAPFVPLARQAVRRHAERRRPGRSSVKAAYFERHGGLDVLKVGELPSPALGPGDVRVRVKAAALNHLDLFVRDGWPGLKLPLPHVGGTDLAGVVSEVAPGVKGVKAGDEVLVNPGLNFEAAPDGEQRIPPDVSIVGETRWGGLAEECVVPATHVLPKPSAMSWEEAAALPLAAITAMQMVKRKGRVKRGDRKSTRLN